MWKMLLSRVKVTGLLLQKNYHIIVNRCCWLRKQNKPFSHDIWQAEFQNSLLRLCCHLQGEKKTHERALSLYRKFFLSGVTRVRLYFPFTNAVAFVYISALTETKALVHLILSESQERENHKGSARKYHIGDQRGTCEQLPVHFPGQCLSHSESAAFDSDRPDIPPDIDFTLAMRNSKLHMQDSTYSRSLCFSCECTIWRLELWQEGGRWSYNVGLVQVLYP